MAGGLATGVPQLDTDGANLAEYLLNISRQSPQAFQGILGSLRYVLPYVTELQVASTSEIERLLYLQMGEGVAGASEVLERARQAGVARFLAPGTTLADSREAVEVASRYDGGARLLASRSRGPSHPRAGPRRKSVVATKAP